MYVVGDLLEELERVLYKVHKQIRIVVAAIYEVVIQLSKAQTLPVDKLPAPLLYEQLEVAETNGFGKGVSDCTGLSRTWVMMSAGRMPTM